MPYPDGLPLDAFSRYLGDDIEERAPRPLTQCELASIAAVESLAQQLAAALHTIRSMPQIDRTDLTADARETLAGMELDLGGMIAQAREAAAELRAVPDKELEDE